MKTLLNREVGWRGALGELVIVIVGVIIALGVESWWSDRQDRVAEKGHLEALQSEFTENLGTVNGNMEFLERVKGSVRDLVGMMEGGRQVVSQDSLVQLTWIAFSFPPYEPQTTAYQNLVNTGDINALA